MSIAFKRALNRVTELENDGFTVEEIKEDLRRKPEKQGEFIVYQVIFPRGTYKAGEKRDAVQSESNQQSTVDNETRMDVLRGGITEVGHVELGGGVKKPLQNVYDLKKKIVDFVKKESGRGKFLEYQWAETEGNTGREFIARILQTYSGGKRLAASLQLEGYAAFDPELYEKIGTEVYGLSTNTVGSYLSLMKNSFSPSTAYGWGRNLGSGERLATDGN